VLIYGCGSGRRLPCQNTLHSGYDGLFYSLDRSAESILGVHDIPLGTIFVGENHPISMDEIYIPLQPYFGIIGRFTCF